MRASKNCTDIIKRFEGLFLIAYECPASLALPKEKKFYTIGYGHTRNVKPGDVINEFQADIFLSEDLKTVEDNLNRLDLPINQNQFDALCSLVFNVGIGAFMKSNLLAKIKAGDPSAAEEFLDWTKAGGKVLPGLVLRRKAEYDFFNCE